MKYRNIYIAILNNTERIPSDRNLTGFFGPSIIPYQELRGDYNEAQRRRPGNAIIPYQELRGDYNWYCNIPSHGCIIPYQELRGDYNMRMRMVSSILIIPYQELRGDYNRPVDVSVLAESYHTKNYEGTTTGSRHLTVDA